MTPARLRSQCGFSLVEILVASCVALAAMMGALYLYRNQHRNMMVQSEIATMRMNGQFTLNETKYSLARAGLGLPPNMKFIAISRGDLVIKTNPTKKSTPGAMAAESNALVTVFKIPKGDVALFNGKGFSAVLTEDGVVEAEILSTRTSGSNGFISLAADEDKFTSSTKIYPMEQVRLHRCQGTQGDGPDGDFRILREIPGGNATQASSLTLAEGIEAMDFRYHSFDGDESTQLPDNLDNLEQIEIIVRVRTPNATSDTTRVGQPRQTLRAKVNYHRTL